MKYGRAILTGLVALALLVQCKGEALLVGDGADAGLPETGAGEAGVAEAGDADAGAPLDATVVWQGYFENYTFQPSGSDHLTLTFTKDDATGLTGTVFFGDPPALPPPTDPSVGYPPSAPTSNPVPPPPSWERFNYTIIGGSHQASRVTFDVVADEFYKRWCEIQTVIYPIYNSPQDAGQLIGYGCVPNATTTFNTSGQCFWNTNDGTGEHPIDCGKLALCIGRGVCTCTPTRCTVDIGPPLPSSPGTVFHFDLTIDADTATGSVAGLSGTPRVHLARQ